MVRFLLAVFLALGFVSTCVEAQTASPKMFVASTGNDANDGSRASPKRSFQAAHDSVGEGGEIVVLDTAGYGAVRIFKTVSIVAPPGVSAFVTVNAGNVGISVGAYGLVVLRGLIVEGAGSTDGSIGIRGGGGMLVVEDTIVRNLETGIASGTGGLVVRRGAVRNTSTGISVAGIDTPINALITDIELTGNTTAITVQNLFWKDPGQLILVASRCTITGSSIVFWLNSLYPQVVVDECTIAGNGTVFATSGDGVFYTRSNNTIYNNTNLGTTPIPLAGR